MVAWTRMAMLAVAALGMDHAVGGWAVVTVENPPMSLEAGSRFALEFTIRQHGVTPMNDLTPTVSVTDGAPVRADRTSQPGRYRATIVAPATGVVALQVNAGWHDTRLILLPIPVVAAGAPPVALAAADWGRHLFVAKGCGTCHVNHDVPEFAERNRVESVGPELTNRRLEAAYIRQRIADPASLPALDKWNRMPNLGLSQGETESLVALLTQPTRSASR